MTDARSPEERFGALADDFVNRHRQGQKPSAESYAAAHPDLADEILRAFPALVMMEEFKPGSRDVTGDVDTAAVVVRGTRLERLGDFRVLREAGRGGMGVVYEAEQESLGRRVALKVMAAHAIPDPARVKRFEREARAAAQLHHTNIVPVFGVGQHEGLHYYAMQFIAGLGLDNVIEEVKRLRIAKPTSAHAIDSPPDSSANQGGIAPTTGGLAWSLVTEQFGSAQQVADLPSSMDASRPGEPGTSPDAPRSMVQSADPSSEVVLGPSGLSSPSGSDAGYWRSVARVGLQVANALEYAHSQGIFHRDIKPSNLLLDPQGTAWVTDFGLAKAVEVEGGDLTHTGDIVGTIRYMAPERFQGRCDARSDVYSLGLTLYEMVALRPAFEQVARQTLIHQVMEDEPARLRKLSPGMPRDLETIIQKAIARDPAARYQTAAALAEDLTLFRDGMPVRARETGTLERVWKLARRRPAIAALLAALMLAVLTGLTLVTWQWRAAVAARDEARQTLKMANQAVNTYFTTVSEQKLLNEPGMQPLRQELMKLSLPYYQAFVAQRGDDPALRTDLAKAYLNWGRATAELGSKNDARNLLKIAVSHFESLLQADPTDRNLQAGLAHSYIFLAQTPATLDDPDLRFEEIKRAAAACLKIVVAAPDDPAPRRMLAQCYDVAGVMRKPGSCPIQAILRESRDCLARRHPRLSFRHRGLASARGIVRKPRVPPGLPCQRRPGRGRSTHRGIH